MREAITTAKTVEEAVENACRELGVNKDDLNVSYEIIDMPVKKLFKFIPAKVRVMVEEEPEAPAPAPKAEEKAAEKAPEKAAEKAAPAPAAPKQENKAAAQAEEARAEDTPADEEKAVEIEENAKLKAAAEYLRTVFAALGVENVSLSAVQSGEAVVLKVEGDNVGVLIGHRGETMESLSYLASLVANRLDGDYLKLGLDVAGYRGKRENDLKALARRHAQRVKKTGHSYALEPMNPYERRIIHSAVSKIEGVRSESRGEGQNRRVVIYSTDPNASNTPERERRGGRNGRGERAGRSGERRGRGGERRERGGRGARSSVPEREYANVQRDESAQPMAPKRTQRIDDAGDFALYGKIEL